MSKENLNLISKTSQKFLGKNIFSVSGHICNDDFNDETLCCVSDKGKKLPPAKYSNILTELESLISDVFLEVFEIDSTEEYRGEFKLELQTNELTLTHRWDDEDEVIYYYPFAFTDFVVENQRIICNANEVSLNYNFTQLSENHSINKLTTSEYLKILKTTPDRLSFYVVGIGGDAFADLVEVQGTNAVIKPDVGYSWEFSDEIEIVYLAVDLEKTKLKMEIKIPFLLKLDT